MYRIAIEPTGSRLCVSAGGQVIADSAKTMLLRETYLPDQIYFPKSDLIDGLLEPSDLRTFCPFKGTAHYWHLRLPSGTIKNGAWSYEKPLQEAFGVGGYVAFDRRLVDEISAEPPLSESKTEMVGGRPLINWLTLEAWLCKTPSELTEQFALQLVKSGIPLWRLTINLWTLHPEIAGRRFTWMRGRAGIAESDTPHGILQSPAYRNSPVRFVSEGLGGVRQRLDIDNPEFQFPILEELRAGGGTDYVAIPLAFSDGRFQTLTMATDHPEGFTTAQLGAVFEAFAVLGRFYEVLTLRRDAEVLFDTYLGQRTGRQVLAGLTHRGAGQVVRAAILYCDLRNSTVLAEALSRESYLNLLNDFFERAVDPVLAGGGEVLKFIGDAVLAIFPLEGEAASDDTIRLACQKAREAAQAIVARVSAAPPRGDGLSMQCAVGVHFGDVMYGNVGASKRLDFTVIGQPANIAARLSGLCKELGQPLLFSDELAGYVPEGLICLGAHKLRNVGDEQKVFAVTGTDFG
jgi:class 3 adenylate cyclase/uncharacterized protein (DUF427 family)